MFKWINSQLILFWNTIQFRWYKYEADRMHELTGKRYFVIPKSDSRLSVVDNNYIKRYNKAASKLHFNKITFLDLIESCYYCTTTGTTSNRKKPK